MVVSPHRQFRESQPTSQRAQRAGTKNAYEFIHRDVLLSEASDMEGISAAKPAANTGHGRPERVQTEAGSAHAGGRVGEHPAPASSEKVEATQPLQIEAVEQLAVELSAALNQSDGDFSVSVDQEFDVVVVTVTDEKTGEVVKQFPPKEFLDGERNMDTIVGLLIDDEV